MLHIFNGDTSLAVFAESDLPGDACVFADALHGGRLMADPTDTAFTSERILYAAQSGFAPPDEVAARMATWCRGLEAAPSHDEVVLWFEHDLFDQLLLLHHLEWLSRRGIAPGGRPVVSLICIGTFEGVPDFKGLGQLSPVQLASLFPAREPVSAEAFELGRRAWAAVAGDDPRAIERVLDGDTSALPYLAGALRRLLEEYPGTGTGLSRTEAQGLLAIAEGATTRTAFEAQAAMEERVFLGDLPFFHLLRELAGAPEPLLEIEVAGAPETVQSLPDGTVSLTPFGRDVLAGRADHAVVNGLDRWVGGVRLQGRTPRWRWDAGSGRIAGPFEPAD